MLGRAVTFAFLLSILWMAYSAAVHFDLIPLEVEKVVPRVVFYKTPRRGPSVEWAYKSLTRAPGILVAGRMHSLSGPLGFLPLFCLVGGPLWILLRGRAQRRVVAEAVRPFDGHLTQIRELVRLGTNHEILADTCDEALNRHQGFMSEREVIECLQAQGEAKLRTGHGMEAMSSFQKLKEKRPDDLGVVSGLLRSYRLVDRRVPPPVARQMLEVLEKVRPLHPDVVRFYLEQCLKPSRPGETPLDMPDPIALIERLGVSHGLTAQLQTHLAEMTGKKGPTASRALTTLARLALLQKKPAVAKLHARNAIDADPRHDGAYAEALRAFREANDLRGLHAFYTDRFEQDRGNVSLQDAIQTLYDTEPSAATFGPNPVEDLPPPQRPVSHAPPTAGAAPEVDGEEIPMDASLTPEERFVVAVNALKQDRPSSARGVLESLVDTKFPRPDALHATLIRACLRCKDPGAARQYAERVELSRLPAGEVYPLAREIESSGELLWARDVYKALLEETPGFRDVQDRLDVIENDLKASGHAV